ncbi:MAG: hypothetical protein R3F59_20780 [Myxococcota bacterium]
MNRVWVALLGLAACVEGPNGVPSNLDSCSSGTMWNGGEGSTMRPGDDCIACHARGEGPDYTVAGTVMGASDDQTNCDGADGVTVRITDANGAVTELVTNGAGNFYTRDHIATPYTVELERDGATSQMVSAQTETDCMVCHTQDGANGAPGRIVAP